MPLKHFWDSQGKSSTLNQFSALLFTPPLAILSWCQAVAFAACAGYSAGLGMVDLAGELSSCFQTRDFKTSMPWVLLLWILTPLLVLLSLFHWDQNSSCCQFVVAMPEPKKVLLVPPEPLQVTLASDPDSISHWLSTFTENTPLLMCLLIFCPGMGHGPGMTDQLNIHYFWQPGNVEVEWSSPLVLWDHLKII